MTKSEEGVSCKELKQGFNLDAVMVHFKILFLRMFFFE